MHWKTKTSRLENRDYYQKSRSWCFFFPRIDYTSTDEQTQIYRHMFSQSELLVVPLPALEHHMLLYLIHTERCTLGPDVLADGLMKFAMLSKDHCSSRRRKALKIRPIPWIMCLRPFLGSSSAHTLALVIMEVIAVEKPFRFTLSILDKLSFHILNNLLRFSVIPASFHTALDSTIF